MKTPHPPPLDQQNPTCVARNSSVSQVSGLLPAWSTVTVAAETTAAGVVVAIAVLERLAASDVSPGPLSVVVSATDMASNILAVGVRIRLADKTLAEPTSEVKVFRLPPAGEASVPLLVLLLLSAQT
jgi:hypothetical protein